MFAGPLSGIGRGGEDETGMGEVVTPPKTPLPADGAKSG